MVTPHWLHWSEGAPPVGIKLIYLAAIIGGALKGTPFLTILAVLATGGGVIAAIVTTLPSVFQRDELNHDISKFLLLVDDVVQKIRNGSTLTKNDTGILKLATELQLVDFDDLARDDSDKSADQDDKH